MKAPGIIAMTQLLMETIKEHTASVCSSADLSYRTEISQMCPVSVCSSNAVYTTFHSHMNFDITVFQNGL